ncbi:MAG: D-alanyl-lipoteichoic acid acyltransferase DltB (MBOAT superfamily) [Akkermansiaceae bacterium]|mgnify:FL=1
MLFHTWTFAAFVAVALLGFFALRPTRFWLPWLFLASYVFYGCWSPYYLILILYSTTMDYSVVSFMDRCPRTGGHRFDLSHLRGTKISSPRLRLAYWGFIAAAMTCLAAAVINFGNLRPMMLGLCLILSLMAMGTAFSSRKIWLAVSLINNLSLLAFFKYAGFFSEALNRLLASVEVPLQLPEVAALMPTGFEYLLPVGISFFMFQSMSYTIDFYRGEIDRERSFIRFATFVAFFPQLVAGPIERASHLLPQFHSRPQVTGRDVSEGLSLFLVGLFKKLALANYLSIYVERIYDDPSAQNAPALLLATFAFAWQIYFDFSGYTDMARGVARWFGFRLMLNFNHPYLAASLGEFWSRWHISLSTWFRDYVYIPLGGNRRGSWLTCRNLLITFVISGLWHGAAWTFLIWGALHGIGILLTRRLERADWYHTRLPKPIKQIAVFLFVGFAWIFFRADSLETAATIIKRIGTTPWTDPGFPGLMLALIGAVWGYQYLSESRYKQILQWPATRITLATGMIVYLLLFSSKGGEFIYFQF